MRPRALKAFVVLFRQTSLMRKQCQRCWHANPDLTVRVVSVERGDWGDCSKYDLQLPPTVCVSKANIFLSRPIITKKRSILLFFFFFYQGGIHLLHIEPHIWYSLGWKSTTQNTPLGCFRQLTDFKQHHACCHSLSVRGVITSVLPITWLLCPGLC